jgi:hypothetical protein
LELLPNYEETLDLQISLRDVLPSDHLAVCRRSKVSQSKIL